jgi:hypothetical protein
MSATPPESGEPAEPLTGHSAWDDYVRSLSRTLAKVGLTFTVSQPELVDPEKGESVSFVFVGKRDG